VKFAWKSWPLGPTMFTSATFAVGVLTAKAWHDAAGAEANLATDPRLGLLSTVYTQWGAQAAELATAYPSSMVGATFALAQLVPLAALVPLAVHRDDPRGLVKTALWRACWLAAALLLAMGPSLLSEPSRLGFWSGLADGSALWLRLALLVLPYSTLALAAGVLTRSRGASIAVAAMTLLVLRVLAFQLEESGLSLHRFMLSALPERVMVFPALSLLFASLTVSLWTALFFVVSLLICWRRRPARGDGWWKEMRSRVKLSFAKNATSIVLVTLLLPLFAGSARAYEKEGHHRLTNAAYQAMRAASAATTSSPVANRLKTPGDCTAFASLCKRAVSQAEWTSFLVEIEKSRRIVGSQPNQIPPVSLGEVPCYPGTIATEIAQFPTGLTASHRVYNKNECSRESWSPLNFYHDIAAPADGTKLGGQALGWHAKNRDDDLQETRVELPIATWPLQQASVAWQKFGAAIFAPLVCAVKLFKGEIKDCLNASRRVADKTNIAGMIFGAIPGVKLDRNELLIGFWHLIDVTRGGAYDDHPGMYLAQGGLKDQRSVIDQALWLVFMTSTAKINRDQSNGVARYQIRDADGHQATRDRGPNNLTFSMYDVGNTEFSPLDNLAHYGFAKLSDQPATRLGWPLHAIGDATVPMHVIASTGQGHAVYEQWVTSHLDELLYEACPASSGGICDVVALRNDQEAQAHRILQIAFRWRQYLNTGSVRGFITALAEDTLGKAGGDTRWGWAWCDACSASTYFEDYGLDDFTGWLAQIHNAATGPAVHEIKDNPHAYYDGYTSEIRKLVESAIGAKVAFLSWAGKTAYPQCIANTRYGCVTDADCCGTAAGFKCMLDTNTCNQVPIN
jgi:hypothetical protein